MRHTLQVPLHDMYNVRFNRHKITNESCTWPCRKDTNWFWIMRCFLQVPSYNLHCTMFSSKLGQWCLLQVLNVKWGQGCLLQVPCGTTWTTFHQRKRSNSSPMDPNTEIQCEKKGLRERGITSGMFGQVTVWNGYSPMDSFLFLAAWTSGHNWAMKRPVLHNIRQPHKWESWWLSFKWTQRCLLQGTVVQPASGYHWNLESHKHGESHQKRKVGIS